MRRLFKNVSVKLLTVALAILVAVVTIPTMTSKISANDSYTIKYNGNYASGVDFDAENLYDYDGGQYSYVQMDNISADGKTVVLSPNHFVRTGYRFVGWGIEASVSESGNNEIIIAESNTNISDITSYATYSNKVINLYAVWSPILTLSYKNIDPSFYDTNPNQEGLGLDYRSVSAISTGYKVASAAKIADTPAESIRDTFAGWYWKDANGFWHELVDNNVNETLFNQLTGHSATSLGEAKTLTLYAKWTHQINYYFNLDSYKMPSSVKEDLASAIPNGYAELILDDTKIIGYSKQYQRNQNEHYVTVEDWSGINAPNWNKYDNLTSNESSSYYIGTNNDFDFYYDETGKVAYHFEAWATAATEAVNPNHIKGADITTSYKPVLDLYAKWEDYKGVLYLNTEKIDTEGTDGSIIAALDSQVNKTEGQVIFPTSGTIPGKSGYEYKGIFTTATFVVDSDITAIKDVNSKPYQYYIKWNYKIAYDANLDEDETNGKEYGFEEKVNSAPVVKKYYDSEDYTYTISKALRSFTSDELKLNRKGYTLVGWNTKADGTGRHYDLTQSVTDIIGLNGDSATIEEKESVYYHVLYAEWKANEYTIHYNFNDNHFDIDPDTEGDQVTGTGSTAAELKVNSKDVTSMKVTYDSTCTFNVPVREGYKFAGWYLANKNGKIILNSDDKAVLLTNFQGKVVYEYSAPTAEPALGLKWIDPIFDEDKNYIVDHDIYVNAVWEPITYKVIFNSNRPSTASNSVEGTVLDESLVFDNEGIINVVDIIRAAFNDKMSIASGTSTAYEKLLVGIDDYKVTLNYKFFNLYAGGTTFRDSLDKNTSNCQAIFSKNILNGNEYNLYNQYLVDYLKEYLENNYLGKYISANFDLSSATISKVDTQNTMMITSDNVATVATLITNAIAAFVKDIQHYNYDAALDEPTWSEERVNSYKATIDLLKGTNPTVNLNKNAYSIKGWKFTGWNTKADGTGIAYSDEETVINLVNESKNVVLYAQWTPVTYNIEFYSGVGSDKVKEESNVKYYSSDSNKVKDLVATYEQTYDYTPESITGFAFVGWYTDAALTTKVDSIKNIIEDPNKDNSSVIKLYAGWQEAQYVVKYDKNKPQNATSDVTGEMLDTALNYLDQVNLTENAYALTGWTFKGWNTKADGTGTDYDDKAQIEKLKDTNGSELVLYAQWEQNKFTVKYDSNKPTTASGTISQEMSDQDVYYDATSNTALTDNAYTLTGWTFKGWNTKADGTGTTYANKADVKNALDGTSGKETLELFAMWEANSFKVIFDSNKPSNASHTVTSSDEMTDQIIYYDAVSDTTLKSNSFALSGWTFKGWNTKADGTGTTYADKADLKNLLDGTSGNDTLTLYAVWKAKTFSFEFDSNKPAAATGSVTGEMAKQSFTYDAATGNTLTPNAFAIDGWTFTGWNSLANGLGTSYADGEDVANEKRDGDFVLYAQWSQNEYEITFNLNNKADEQYKGLVTNSAQINGLVIEDANTYKYNALYENSYTVLLPTKIGYRFVGWNTNPDANFASTTGWYFKYDHTNSKFKAIDVAEANLDDVNSTFKQLAKEDDTKITLYAIWSVNAYTIVFDSNKPAASSRTLTGSVDNQIFEFDQMETTYAKKLFLDIIWDETKPVVTAIDGTTVTLSTSLPTAEEINTKAKTLLTALIGKDLTFALKVDGSKVVEDRVGTVLTITSGNIDAIATSVTSVVTAFINEVKADKTDWSEEAVCGYSDLVLMVTKSETEPAVNGVKLTKNSYKLPGWTFTGWNTLANGTGVSYSDEEIVKNLTSEDGKTITLYAQWEQNVTTVHLYNGIEGTNYPTLTTPVYEFDVKFDSKNFVLDKMPGAENYTLIGIYDAPQYYTLEEKIIRQSILNVVNVSVDSETGLKIASLKSINEDDLQTIFKNRLESYVGETLTFNLTVDDEGHVTKSDTATSITLTADAKDPTKVDATVLEDALGKLTAIVKAFVEEVKAVNAEDCDWSEEALEAYQETLDLLHSTKVFDATGQAVNEYWVDDVRDENLYAWYTFDTQILSNGGNFNYNYASVRKDNIDVQLKDYSYGGNETLGFIDNSSYNNVDYSARKTSLTKTIVDGKKVTTLTITKEGYHLKKGEEFNTQPDGTGTSYGLNDVLNEYVGTLYANWEKNTYTVYFINDENDSYIYRDFNDRMLYLTAFESVSSFNNGTVFTDLNGKDIVLSKEYDSTYNRDIVVGKVMDAVIAFIAEAKADKEGWSEKAIEEYNAMVAMLFANSSSLNDSQLVVRKTIFALNIIKEADLEKDIYEVVFDEDKLPSLVNKYYAEQTFTYDGGNKTLRTNVFDYFVGENTYVFTGWEINDTVKYTDGQVVANLTTKNNGIIRLTPKFEEGIPVRYYFDETHYIAVDDEPLNITNTNTTVVKKGFEATKTITLDTNGITRKGYTFGGFYKDSSYTESLNEINDAVKTYDTDGTTILAYNVYVKWIPVQYNVVLYLEGGESTVIFTDDALTADNKLKHADELKTKAESLLNELKGEKIIDVDRSAVTVKSDNISAIAEQLVNYIQEFVDDVLADKSDWSENAVRKYNNTLTLLHTDDESLALGPKLIKELVTYDADENPYGIFDAVTASMNKLPYGTEIKVANPTRKGYTFVGWFTEPDTTDPEKLAYNVAYEEAEGHTFGADVDEYHNLASRTITIKNVSDSNIRLYAGWVENTYNVTFDENAPKRTNIGGTEVASDSTWANNPDDQTMYYDDNSGKTYEVVLSDKVPTRNGYVFKGWSLNADEDPTSENLIAPGTTLTDELLGQYEQSETRYLYDEVTLYAIWDVNEFEIVFDKNDDTINTTTRVVGTEVSSKYDYDVQFALASKTTYTKVGYDFVGWSLVKYNYGDEVDATKVIAANSNKTIKELVADADEGATITLYAVWQPHTYTVEFYGKDANAGTLPVSGSVESQTFTFDENYDNGGIALNANEFTRTGFEFVNWSVATGTQEVKTYNDKAIVVNLTTADKAVIKLYAQWKANGVAVVENNNFAKGTVQLDGQEVAVNEDGTIDINTNSKVIVVTGDLKESEAIYQASKPTVKVDPTLLREPTTMHVYELIDDGNGNKIARELTDFANILEYAGTSVRLTGTKGIRFRTAISTAKKNALTSNAGLDGYNVMEYGTVMCWADNVAAGKQPTIGMYNVASGYAFSKANNVDAVFGTSADGSITYYTNTLVGNYSTAQCNRKFAVRTYMVIRPVGATDASKDITVYGATYYRTIASVANQAIAKNGKSFNEATYGIIYNLSLPVEE